MYRIPWNVDPDVLIDRLAQQTHFQLFDPLFFSFDIRELLSHKPSIMKTIPAARELVRMTQTRKNRFNTFSTHRSLSHS